MWALLVMLFMRTADAAHCSPVAYRGFRDLTSAWKACKALGRHRCFVSVRRAAVLLHNIEAQPWRSSPEKASQANRQRHTIK